jgi:micrococcal nuclease
VHGRHDVTPLGHNGSVVARRTPPVVVGLLAVAAAAFASGACSRSDAATPAHAPPASSTTSLDAGAATLVRVVDGDTIVVRFTRTDTEEHVRLIGIDTPETKKPNTPVECFGKEASLHMVGLLAPKSALRIVRDAEARDRYGRLLAYVYRGRDGLFVNLAMARDGFAAPLTIPPNVAHADEIVAAANAAQRADAGLWARCTSGHDSGHTSTDSSPDTATPTSVHA